MPGGSSSGSAVATARGIVSFALGTDTAGSGRIPAGLNNIVGLKPTVGALSAAGVVPACRTLDCVSVFALTVDDAYAVFSRRRRQATQPIPIRATSTSAARRAPAGAERRHPGKSRPEILRRRGDAGRLRGRACHAVALGCGLVEIPFGDFYATANLLYEGAWVAERYAAIRDFMDSNEAAMHPVTRKSLAARRTCRRRTPSSGLYALQAYKAKLAPSSPRSTFSACRPRRRTTPLQAVLADPVATNSRLGTYTNFVNLLDMCGIAVPTGKRDDGLPMSVTLLAAAGKDCADRGARPRPSCRERACAWRDRLGTSQAARYLARARRTRRSIWWSSARIFQG